MIRLPVFTIAAAIAVAISGQAYASDESSVMGYDSIVDQLNREADRPASKAKYSSQDSDALDTIWFHAGVGLSMLMQPLTFDDGNNVFLDQRGVQISGGIDLFSPNWMAEGTMRNFGESETSRTRVSLKEFELKILFHKTFAPRLGFHAGGGLSARYMTVRRPQTGSNDYVTPTSIAVLGLDYFITDRLSVGIEAAGRSAMVSDTVDRGSYDATIRMDVQL